MSEKETKTRKLRMKTHNVRPLFAAIFGALFLLAGCKGPLHDGGADIPESPSPDRGTVRLRLSGPQTRTLLPAADVLADLYYALRFSADGKPAVNPAPVHSLGAEVELEPGTWALEVKGYATNDEAANPAGEPVVRGSAELTVKPGSITTVSVTVNAKAESGAGTLNYTISFPPDAEKALLVLTPISGGSVTELDLLTGAETEGTNKRKAGTESLSAGYYRLGLEVSLPGDGSSFPRTARKTAVIHIYNGFSTAAAEVFGPDDFYDIPTFTTVEGLSAWLASAAENTPETPYAVVLRELNVETAFAVSGGDPLGKLYAALNGKYLALDLSGCTGTSISNSTVDYVNRRGNKDGIVSLVLPETLKTLGSYAFQNCVSLVSLNWPSSETGTAIGAYAFDGCRSLETAVLPEGLESIGNYGFQNCQALDAIDLPAALKTIGTYAFSGTALVSLDWPAAAANATISNSAFTNCSFLTNVRLPATLSNLGVSAFSGCANLESVYLTPGIPDTLMLGTTATVFPANRNLTFYTDPADTVFRTLLSGKVLVKNTIVVAGPGAVGELSLPDGITEIAAYAFSGCMSLIRVSLPGTLQTIGKNAFQNCTALESVSWTTDPVSLTLDTYAFQNCTALSSITLPSTLTTIGNYAFQNTRLAALTLPGTLQTIGTSAFANCAALQSVSWPTAPVNPVLGEGAFSSCTALTSITLPPTLTSIGVRTFSNTGFTAFTVPATVQTIGNYAFEKCAALQSVNWTSIASPLTLGSNAFTECTALTSVVLPDALTSIGSSAFLSCASLTVITLPTSLETIGSSAFKQTGLTTLTLPTTAKTISPGAFQNCENLRWVKWPVSPAGAALSNANSASGAFSGCTQLEKVELPGNLSDLSNYSFTKCTALRVVVLHAATPPTLGGTSAFPVTTNAGLQFYVPNATAVTAYKAATNWNNADYIAKIVDVSTLALADEPSNWQ